MGAREHSTGFIAVAVQGTMSYEALATWARRCRRQQTRQKPRSSLPGTVRTVIGAIGRVLVTIGLLILFVAYQLWGTGIYEARAQSDLESQFSRELSRQRSRARQRPRPRRQRRRRRSLAVYAGDGDPVE